MFKANVGSSTAADARAAGKEAASQAAAGLDATQDELLTVSLHQATCYTLVCWPLSVVPWHHRTLGLS